MNAAFRRLLEWYLGLPRAEAGQRTDWRLEFHAPGRTGSLPVWFLVLAVGIIAAGVCAVYWRDASSVPRWKRGMLAALRLGTLSLAVLCLLQVTLSLGRVGLPVIAVMIDDSASMGLEDRYHNEESAEVAEQLVRTPGVAGRTRLGLTQAVLTADNSRFLRRLLRHHVLRLYHFSETAARLLPQDLASVEQLPAAKQKILELKADGARTRPGPTLQKVLDDFRGAPPAAVIVFSDGVSSTGEADRLGPAADVAAANYIPLDPVGLGSEQPARDVQLYDVSAEELAFVGDPYAVSGRIKADGFEGQAVTVRLAERESGRVLAETSVKVGNARRPVPFELSYTPTAAGELELAVEAIPLPEETNRENNVEIRHVSVRQEKIRLLLADGAPRWEFRYVKTLFERDPTVSLKTVLQEADADYATEDQTALAHFPLNKEELSRFDVIILGDLNPALLGMPTMNLLRDFARDTGGGVLLIAGPAYNPAAYRGTPLEILVPFDLSELQPVDESASATGFRPELTVDGMRGTSIFRLGASESETLEIWKNLPPLFSVFSSAPLRPGARVFAVRRKSTGPVKEVPVMVMQSVGAGRVLFFGTDEIWRWRFRAGDLYYGPFWSRAVRYLSRARLLGRDRTAELASDRVTYRETEPAVLRVRFFDERFLPPPTERVTVILERRHGERRTVSLARSPGQSTVFEGQTSALPLGLYHAWVASPSFREAPPSTDFRVEAGSDELVKRNLDRRELEQAAQVTHGIYSGLEEASLLPDRIPPGHPVPLTTRERVPLWNRWELLTLVAGLLATEWILRKRLRLL